MELYNSSIASIRYLKEPKLVRTSWKKCDSADDFMQILLKVREFYELLMPKRTLWDQTDFNLNIPPDLQKWFD